MLFFDYSLDELIVLFRGTKAGKYFHHVIDFFLLFTSSLFESLLLFKVEKLTADNELLSPDSFVEFMIIDIYKSELHLFFLLAIIVIEFHFGKQKLGVIVELDFEITSFRHISDYFCRVVAIFRARDHLIHCQRSSF